MLKPNIGGFLCGLHIYNFIGGLFLRGTISRYALASEGIHISLHWNWPFLWLRPYHMPDVRDALKFEHPSTCQGLLPWLAGACTNRVSLWLREQVHMCTQVQISKLWATKKFHNCIDRITISDSVWEKGQFRAKIMFKKLLWACKVYMSHRKCIYLAAVVSSTNIFGTKWDIDLIQIPLYSLNVCYNLIPKTQNSPFSSSDSCHIIIIEIIQYFVHP